MHWPESKETFFNQNVNAFMILSIMNAVLAVDASYVAINNYYEINEEEIWYDIFHFF